jgi:hypothetical protein
MEDVGKMVSVKPGTKPITEGPSRIPVSTSAITLGSVAYGCKCTAHELKGGSTFDKFEEVAEGLGHDDHYEHLNDEQSQRRLLEGVIPLIDSHDLPPPCLAFLLSRSFSSSVAFSVRNGA